MTYNITGTPDSTGTAVFNFDIGGQYCSITMLVQDLDSLYNSSSVFCSSNPTSIIEVTNPITGKVWMDRNLGASRSAISSTDVQSYGDLYQWGRRTDGHQCRNSLTTFTISSSNQPTHGRFIRTSTNPTDDWRNPPNINLWQGVNGINNPCPSGFRVPTYAEFENERLYSWISQDEYGAFTSILKLPKAGYRMSSQGTNNGVGLLAWYWTSTVNGTNSHALYINYQSGVNSGFTTYRGVGAAVRCIKD